MLKAPHQPTHLDMDAMAWTEGLIVTQDIRLSDFPAQVSRYRHGYPGQRRNCRFAPVRGKFRPQTRSSCFSCCRKRCP
jgi:ferric-dicitrate binding protein FerR (iron transport regulator)